MTTPRPITSAIDETALTWAAPSKWMGALSGFVVVSGFTVVHNVFITDIWFNVGPMLFAGVLCGFCIVWSYRQGVADHSTAAWFRYASLYAAELIALGAVSLAACLNLDQQVLSDQVDHEPVNGNLDSISWLGVPLFQRGVEWLLPKGPDMGRRPAHWNDRRTSPGVLAGNSPQVEAPQVPILRTTHFLTIREGPSSVGAFSPAFG